MGTKKSAPPEIEPQHSCEAVGVMAGEIWRYLDTHGAVTLSKLARDLDAPRDLVMQGVGWLAREDKLTYLAGERFKKVALAEPVAE